MSPALLSSRAVASRVDSAAAVGIRTVVATWSQARLLSVVTRGTAPIHLTPKTVRPVLPSSSPYWMDPFSSHVGPCPRIELAGYILYRVNVAIY